MAVTDLSIGTEYGSELKSARISGVRRSGTRAAGGSGSAHFAGTLNAQGSGTTSQLPSPRTPPQGPITMCFGQEGAAAGRICTGPGFHGPIARRQAA